MTRPRHLVALLAMTLAPLATGQTLYKCPAANNTVQFQQMPCSPQGGGEAIKVRPLPMMGVEAAGLRPGEQEMLQRFQHRIDAETGTIRVGMTKTEARRAWGSPDKINRSSSGEQWVYRRARAAAQYLYFDGDVLTAFN